MNRRVTTSARRIGRPPGGRLIADRKQLLDAAERAIAVHGVAVTMEEIAAEASVTKPILYRSIGDRDAVVAALSERFVQRINAAGAAAVSAAIGGTAFGRDVVHQLIRSFVDTVERHTNLFLFVTAGTKGDDQLGQSLSLGDRSAAPLAELLAVLRPAGRRDDPSASLIWARAMIGATQYSTLWWLRDRSCTADELADRVTDLIWSGISSS
jgi:AcrR family transcriptional regulator